MKLKAILQLLPEAEVHKMGAHVKSKAWYVPLTPLEKAEQALLERRHQAQNRLEARASRFLRYVASQAYQERRSRLETLDPHGKTIVDNLLERQLLFEHAQAPCAGAQAIVFLPEEFAGEFSLDTAAQTTLASLLVREKSDYFSALATRYGFERGPKYAVLQQAKERLLTRDFLDRLIQKLSPSERKIWETCLKADGVLDSAELRVLGYPDSSFNHYARAESPLNQLYKAALVFPDREYGCRAIFIPSDIHTLLVGPRAAITMHPAASLPTRAKSWGDRVLADVRLLIAQIVSGQMPLTQKDAPEKRTLMKFAQKTLAVADDAYGLFLWMLAEPLLGSPPLHKATDVLDKDPRQAWLDVIDQALCSGHWMEAYAWRHLAWGPHWVQDFSLPAHRRRLLKALSECPTAEWIEWNAFSTRLELAGLRREEIWTNVHSQTGYGAEDRRPTLEISAAIVAETFLWCGLIEIGYSAQVLDGQPRAAFSHFRLTPQGRAIADETPGMFPLVSAPPRETHFRILPNHDIQLPPRLDIHILCRLLKLAELTGPSTLVLTKDRLRSALDEGQTIEDLVRFLKEHSTTGVPENVEIFLRDLAGKHGHIKIGYAGLYLEVNDPLLLIELSSHKALKNCIVKKISDRLALIDADNPEVLARQLKKLGYFPVLDLKPEDQDMPLAWRLRRPY